jgi:uncharacterized membrane protein/plastocyanin
MDATVGEWLHLLLRWFHIIAGIMWIGSSIFFNWLDSHLTPPEKAKAGVEGELWMVHSGGFYQVEKKMVAPSEMPKVLHWFKWEAAFTWISGFCLLTLLYYMGGGILLVDPEVSSISVNAAIALGIGVLVVSWAVYDTMWKIIGESSKGLATGVTVLLVVAVAFGLSRVLSGRAAYMHVGAMMGTWMVANVWMRILPAQRRLVAAVKEGKKPEEIFAKRAKERSRHNNYMTYPVIFVMISNHFPNTFGVKLSWAVLAGLFLVSVAVKHYQNVKEGSPRTLFVAMGVAFAVAAALSLTLRQAPASTLGTPGKPIARKTPDPAKSGAPASPKIVVDPATAGSLRAVVRLEGTPPPPVELTIPGSCDAKGPVLDRKVLVEGGMLQNAFVWIAEGLEGWSAPPATTEVVLDQHGCMYSPRVLGVEVGQPLAIVNSDPTMHNVHALAKENPEFNTAMPGKAQRMVKTFDAEELMVKMKCDVHPWMSAFIGVVPHPYFGVTDAKGEVSLEKLPPGDYVVGIWHEVYGKETRKVSIAPKGAATVELSFKAP